MTVSRAPSLPDWVLGAENLGAVGGAPYVLVELEGDEPLDWSPGAHPVVMIGVRPPGSADTIAPDHPCDVVLAADDPLLDVVIHNVEAHPIAATSLAVLLRQFPHRRIELGLAAESAVYSMLQAGPEFAAWLQTRPPPQPSVRDEQPVRTERHGNRLIVTLNRPRRHNAVNEPLRAALADALSVAVVDESVTVELRGAGPWFSSGGDLAEFGTFPDPATAHVSRLTRSPGRLVGLLGPRCTAFLHGACMGAGIEVSAFAGRVVADPDAVISLPELGIGLVPGAGGTVSISARIGRHRAALMALSTRSVPASTALEWGLVDDLDSVAPNDSLVG